MQVTRNVLRKFAPCIAGASALLGAVSSQAALPDGATTLFTSIATDGGLVLTAAFGAAVIITGGWIVFDMVKKGAKKAAK